MRFLVDQNLPPLVADMLRRAGHDAVHTREVDMQESSDAEILDRAAAEDRVVFSADTDFGTLLAERASSRPSVVLLRRTQERRAVRVVALLLANLPSVDEALRCGAVVVLQEDRVRVRRLPLR